MRPKLVIAIPTYRRVHVLEPLVRALCPVVERINRENGWTAWEIAISDNSPDDESEKALRPLCHQHAFLHYSRNEKNIGAVPNFYRVCLLREAEYCWLLSDDDVVYFEEIANFARFIAGLKGEKVAFLAAQTAEGRCPSESVSGREFFQRFAFEKINLISRHIFAQEVVREAAGRLAHLPFYAIYVHNQWLIDALRDSPAGIYGEPVVRTGYLAPTENWRGWGFLANVLEYDDYEQQFRRYYDLPPEMIFSRFSSRAFIRNYLIYSLVHRHLPPVRENIRAAVKRRYGASAWLVFLAGWIVATKPMAALVNSKYGRELDIIRQRDYSRRP